MADILLIWVSYALLAVFLVAFVIRATRLARLPVHLRWELAPVPHEKGKAHYGGSFLEELDWWTKPRERSVVNEAAYMFQEIVFLKSVYENNRPLWWFSFPFHFGMYLLIAAAPLMVLSIALNSVGALASVSSTLGRSVPVLTGLGYVLGGVGGLGLLIIRLSVKKMKEVTTPAALFNLVLLLAVFFSGGYALWVSSGFSAGVTDAVRALLTATVPTATGGAMTLHVIVTCVFLAYHLYSPIVKAPHDIWPVIC